MGENNICPRCKQPVEDSARYCGNCGQPLMSAPTPSPVAQVYQNTPPANAQSQPNLTSGAASLAAPVVNPVSAVPNYAVAYPHPKQHRAAMALAIGIVGIGAGLLMAILGVGLGVLGIILSTTSYRGSSKGLKISSLTVSIIAVLLGLAVWVNAIINNPSLHSQKVSQAGVANGVAKLSVTTPCYTVSFSSELNVNNASGSCVMNAYNGSSLSSSSDIYKVLNTSAPELNESNFASLTKKAIESDISQNLVGFSVTNESSSTFSGDTAYYVQANNASANVAVIEEGILHQTSSSQPDFFILVHVAAGQSVNLNNLEQNWHWND